MKHLQVPETKPNNKNTKNHQKILTMQRLDGLTKRKANNAEEKKT